MKGTTVTITKPFYEDHVDRCGNEGHTIVKETKTKYTVTLDDAAFENLHSDCEYYTDPCTRSQMWEEPWLRGICRSADSVLRVLNEARPPKHPAAS